MHKQLVEIIKSPWINKFRQLVGATRNTFTFTSPFIKLSAVNTIMECRKHNFTINGITSFRLRNFERGASDLEAIKSLLYGKALLRNIANIHSKIYIFDSFAAIISSANLTPAGLKGNVELGILLQEETLVKELKNYIESLLSDVEKSFDITEEIIIESENILNAIPRVTLKQERELEDLEKELFKIEDSAEDKIFQSGSSPILNGLSGWKKDVFSCLLNITKDVFGLDEVYKYKKQLFRLHPENRNIRPKIRQQLQMLRDLGLLEFTVKRGVYRKLWK